MADEKKKENDAMARAKSENWPSFGRDVIRQGEPMARAMPKKVELGLNLQWTAEQEAIAKKTSQAMQELGVLQTLLKRTKEDLEDARSAKQIGRALKKAQAELERAKAERDRALAEAEELRVFQHRPDPSRLTDLLPQLERIFQQVALEKIDELREERDRAWVEIEQLRERVVKQETEMEGWHDDMCRRTDEWIAEIQKLRSERDRMQGERDEMREKRDQALTDAERLRAELNRNEQYRFEGRISAANWKKIAQEAQEEAKKAKSEAEAQREHYKQTFLDAAKADVEKQESSEETEQSCGNELDHGGEDCQEEPRQRSPFWVLCSFFLPLLWYGLRPGAKEIRRALAASTRKSGETPISKPQERAQPSNIESKRRFRRRRR